MKTAPHIRPWYREPWPWIIMLPPFAAVIGGVAMLTLAVTSSDGLVSDDYYKEGLAINQVLRRDQHAAHLDLRASVQLSDDRARVRVVFDAAHLPADAPLPAELRLQIVHPTRAGRDQTVTLRAARAGVYESELLSLGDGRWRLTVEDIYGTWRLVGSWQLPQHRSVSVNAQQR